MSKAISLACAVLVGLVTACRAETNTDDWLTSTPAAQSVNPATLLTLTEQITNGAYTGIDSVLIARNNHLIYEEYFGPSDRDSLHTTRSASKAITSALVGIAIDKGHLQNTQVSALSFFPEYEGSIENWDERKRSINISHLLSMTSGVKGNEDAMYPTDDWIKFYFDQPLAASPSESFSYATSGIVTLGNIITRASGLRIPAFTDKYLFEPLGITDYKWPITNSRGNQGLAMTGGGLHLRPRDMLKFGQLYLNGGVWQGQQVISKEWIEASTSKHSTSNLYGEDFGYLWRIIQREFNGEIIQSYEAWGNGGQFIMVFPALNMVAVFTGENYGKFPEMEQPFHMIDHYILPAIQQNSVTSDH